MKERGELLYSSYEDNDGKDTMNLMNHDRLQQNIGDYNDLEVQGN